MTTRDKLDETCPVGWYEYDLIFPGNRRVAWWNGEELFCDMPCTNPMTFHCSRFVGPLVPATDQSLKAARDTFLAMNRAQAAEARVKELTEENARADKTICELEMDLDAARKRCHYAIETKKAEGNP